MKRSARKELTVSTVKIIAIVLRQVRVISSTDGAAAWRIILGTTVHCVSTRFVNLTVEYDFDSFSSSYIRYVLD